MKKWITILFLSFSFITLSFGQDDFINALNDKLSKFTSTYINEDVFTITNSQFYEPKQYIEFKSQIRNWKGNNNIKSKYLHVYLTNNQGRIIIWRKYLIKEETVCNKIYIPENIISGVYYLVASTDKNNFQNIYFKTVYISKNKFSEVNNIVRYNRDYYFPGDTVQIEIRLVNIFGKHLKNKKINYSILSQDEKIDNGQVKTNKSGVVKLIFVIPEDISNSLLKFEFKYNYASNKQSFMSFCKIANKTLNIEFYPEGGTLINKYNSLLAFKITDSTGFPIKTIGILKNSNKMYRLESNKDGIGFISFIPDFNSSYKIKLNQPKDLTLKYKFPKIDTSGTTLKVENINEDYVTAIFSSSDLNDTLFTYWILDQNGIIKWGAKVRTLGTTNYNIPCDSLSHDFARITVFNKNQEILNERIIFIPKDLDMVKISSEINNINDSVQIKLNLSSEEKHNTYYSSLSIINKAYFDSTIINDFIQYYTTDPQIFHKEYTPGLYSNNGNIDYKEIEKISLTFKNNYIQWDSIIRQEKNNVLKNQEIGLKKLRQENNKHLEELYSRKIKEYNNYRNYNSLLTIRELNFNNISRNQDLYINGIKKIKESNRQSSNKKNLVIKKLQNSDFSLEQAIMQLKPYETDHYGHIIFRGHSSMYYEQGALIIVDGAKIGNNISDLRSIPSSSIADIKILLTPYETISYFTLYSSIIDIKTTVGKKIDDKDIKRSQTNIFQQNFLWSSNIEISSSDQINLKLKKSKNNSMLIFIGLNKLYSPFYYVLDIK